MKSLRALKPYLRRYRKHYVAGLAFVFLANFFAIEVPVFVGTAVNVAETGRASRIDLLWLAGFIVTLAGLGACFRFLMRRVVIDTSRDLEFDIRNAFFKKLQQLDPAYYDGRNTGDLMARGTNDMEAVRTFLGPSLMYLANTLFAAPLILAQMVVLDWKLSAMALTPMLLLPPLVLAAGRQMHARSREQQDEFGHLTTFAQENIAGIQVVKAYRQEEPQTRQFLDRNNIYNAKSMRLAMITSLFFPMIRMVVGLGLVVILVAGGRDVMHGALQVGTLVSLVMLFGMIVWPLIAVGWVINLMQRGLASLARMNDVFEAQPLVSAPQKPVKFPLSPDLEIRNLTFQYPGTTAPQLHDINVSIPFGTTVGIIGPVGCGKSTLVNLLARLYPVERGEITLGEADINDLDLPDLRRNIGFVFQESFLFSETIAWNIQFGARHGISIEEMREAARRAALEKEVERFPDKYETELGERGINLSGGQKQRLALARAIVRDASILVLDDALSAVDTHTEEEILASLRDVMRGRTVFLISHRVSTLALADVILVIEDGRITQRGSHDELVAQEGLYQRLAQKQTLERAIETFDGVPEPGSLAPAGATDS